jgi:tetratricopeptide (TPR) repeat protein
LRYALCILFTAFLLSFPVRAFIADYYYNRVSAILDNKSTEYLDVKEISAGTMPDYLAAIKSLEKSATLHPTMSIYYKALSDIYARLGIWADTMEAMNEALPVHTLSSKVAFVYATSYLKTAISLEPTNPDYHLALGQLYDTIGADSSVAEKELTRAINAYPVNAPLRYAVASHYLLTGRTGDALEHTGVLARIDDSYIFSALEIAWRVSGDPEVVKGIAPDNPDARAAVELFLEWKGMEE